MSGARKTNEGTADIAANGRVDRNVMCWSAEAPTVADLAGNGEEYFWVRGGNFNRPLVVRANNGVTSAVLDGVRKFWPEVNFEFFADGNPGHIWRHDLHKWPGFGSLEWAGPVPRPTHNAELCGGPSGPSERAPGYASAPKTEE